jgi:hypothetical protein
VPGALYFVRQIEVQSNKAQSTKIKNRIATALASFTIQCLLLE